MKIQLLPAALMFMQSVYSISQIDLFLLNILNSENLTSSITPLNHTYEDWNQNNFAIVYPLNSSIITGYIAHARSFREMPERFEIGFIKNGPEVLELPIATNWENKNAINRRISRPGRHRAIKTIFLIYRENIGAAIDRFKEVFLSMNRANDNHITLLTKSFADSENESEKNCLAINVLDETTSLTIMPIS